MLRTLTLAMLLLGATAALAPTTNASPSCNNYATLLNGYASVSQCRDDAGCWTSGCGYWEYTHTGVYVDGEYVAGLSTECSGQAWDYNNRQCNTGPSVLGLTPVTLQSGPGGDACVDVNGICIGIDR